MSIRSDTDVKPTWSPEAKSIAFESYRDPGKANADIWVVKADGTKPRRLTGTPLSGELFPAWSPDGRRIAFMTTRDANWEIYTTTLDGRARPLISTPKTEELPAWSPDGRRLVFDSDLAKGGRDVVVDLGGRYGEQGLPEDPSPKDFDLFEVNLDGTCLRRLTKTGANFDPAVAPSR